MQYLGGKSRIAKQLAPVINEVRAGRYLWEPFCGGLGITAALGGVGCASDAHGPLIELYRAVRAGWQPPLAICEAEYLAAKGLADSDPLKAFCGFACSFSGKYFAGYARGAAGRNYALSGRNAVVRDVDAAQGFAFEHCDFLAVVPGPIDALIYCDPPYFGTTGYSLNFDHGLFYQRVAQWSEYADVLISEYTSPLGVCIFEQHRSLEMQSGTKAAGRTERLFFIPKGSV